ncbi:hypothetical protein K438DRAFT_1982339 [Mycena galopus ATCC 62051]|nr:hypothetical protein K438DRAFT_1982339 [Mycena galopus ATCC 62051]
MRDAHRQEVLTAPPNIAAKKKRVQAPMNVHDKRRALVSATISPLLSSSASMDRARRSSCTPPYALALILPMSLFHSSRQWTTLQTRCSRCFFRSLAACTSTAITEQRCRAGTCCSRPYLHPDQQHGEYVLPLLRRFPPIHIHHHPVHEKNQSMAVPRDSSARRRKLREGLAATRRMKIISRDTLASVCTLRAHPSIQPASPTARMRQAQTHDAVTQKRGTRRDHAVGCRDDTGPGGDVRSLSLPTLRLDSYNRAAFPRRYTLPSGAHLLLPARFPPIHIHHHPASEKNQSMAVPLQHSSARRHPSSQPACQPHGSHAPKRIASSRSKGGRAVIMRWDAEGIQGRWEMYEASSLRVPDAPTTRLAPHATPRQL